MAALLEAADEEFMRLKNDLGDYTNGIRGRVRALTPGTALDKVTLKLFIETSELLRSTEDQHRWVGQSDLVDVSAASLDQYLKCFERLAITHIDSLANALERHRTRIERAIRRCEQVNYGPDFCHAPVEGGWSLWTLIQLLCADKPTRTETIEAMKSIELYIADSLEDYADSLRAIVRDGEEMLGPANARDFKSVYLTLAGDSGGASYPMELRGDTWVWENVTVTDEHVSIDGEAYAFISKNPLYADVVHRGKRFIVTW